MSKTPMDGWLQRLDWQLDLNDLLEGCCRVLLQWSGADRCSVMVLDSDTEELVVRWAYGHRVKPRGARLRFRVGEGLCGWVARSQKAICANDASREPRFVPPEARGPGFRPVRAICCLPLLVEGRTIGVVNLSRLSSTQPLRRLGQQRVKRFLDRLARVIYQITLLHEAQAVSQRFRRQAKVLSETVAQVSHEIRTPLTLITEAAQQLLDGLGGPLGPSHGEHVQLIHSQSERVLQLVTELLDISRIEAGRMSLHRAALELPEIIWDVKERYKPLIAPRELKMELEPVPAVYADRVRVTQVVENLITNAVKFTPADGRITLRLTARGNFAELSVADTGMGIPLKEQRRLFEKFSQIHVRSGQAPRGTGLGLSIVKEVVQFHGGTVRVQSEEGKGATFFVSLPFYTPAFALTEEFRVMREEAARQGRLLAVELIEPAPRPAAPAADAASSLDLLRHQVSSRISREDRVLESPSGGLVILSVLDREGFPTLRERIRRVLEDNQVQVGGQARLGWALVPLEETSLREALSLAERRARGEEAEIPR